MRYSTRLYDDLRGPEIWPEQYDGRVVVNESYFDAEKGVDVETLKEQYQQAFAGGDWSRLGVWA